MDAYASLITQNLSSVFFFSESNNQTLSMPFCLTRDTNFGAKQTRKDTSQSRIYAVGIIISTHGFQVSLESIGAMFSSPLHQVLFSIKCILNQCNKVLINHIKNPFHHLNEKTKHQSLISFNCQIVFNLRRIIPSYFYRWVVGFF